MASGGLAFSLVIASFQVCTASFGNLRGSSGDAANSTSASGLGEHMFNGTAADGTMDAQGQWIGWHRRWAQSQPGRWAMSCAEYGCGPNFIWGQGCQCSAECEMWGSCCEDFERVCPIAGAPDPEPGAPSSPVLHAPAGPASPSSSSTQGSCALYGCGGRYHRSRSCQCNKRCSRHGNCCADYAEQCGAPAEPAPVPGAGGNKGEVVTVYHQTSKKLGPIILETGFKPGSEGWCGGAIYFAKTRAATYTKAIGVDSHQGFMIEAQVDLGRVLHLESKCIGYERVSEGFDSIIFNPGDGDEIVVYSKDRILSTKATSM